MPHDSGYPLTTTREYIHLIPISVGKWRRVSNQCEWSRSEDRGGGGREGEEGKDKNAGRNDRRDREDPGGGSVSSHRHTLYLANFPRNYSHFFFVTKEKKRKKIHQHKKK